MPILSERVWSALSLVLGLYQVILQPSTTPPAASTVDVTIPLITPSAAVSVAPDLVSLSIEQDRWDFWAGTTKRNDFFYNALDNSTWSKSRIRRHSSGLVLIPRIAPTLAIMLKYTSIRQFVVFSVLIWHSSIRKRFFPPAVVVPLTLRRPTLRSDKDFMTSYLIFLPASSYSHALQLILTRACLIGTRVQWGVNLREYNLTAAYLETKALIQAFGSLAVKSKGITLNLIEVGNEANLYRGGGRYKSWNVTEYVSQ